MHRPILYSVFHLNLAFSSVEEEDRAVIIERCYWPLLKLAEEGLPVGIEATGYTLAAINRLDPSWTTRFADLIADGKAELIGSGFCQIIAPLVPAELTRRNLAYGLADYEALLGVKPKIALVNEQAYSRGVLPLYGEAGFEAVMMDWAEPSSHNKDWDPDCYLQPQLVEGAAGVTLPVIWSDAISFQKFQRYAHGELTADEYFEFLSQQIARGAKAIPLYTSDAEVFDHRPGRFQSEAKLNTISEFERIRLLLRSLESSGDVTLALPSEALRKLAPSSQPLHLETSSVPVPVKKQRKYNVTRWGVTGRDDVLLNTHCWRIFRDLKEDQCADDSRWRQLCRFWASDFRTHITQKRWQALVDELPQNVKASPETGTGPDPATALPAGVNVQRVGRFLSIEANGLHLVLNLHRGLAIQSFGYGDATRAASGRLSDGSVMGTLAHGFFDDIAYGADFYSGHYVLEPSQAHKVTDLAHVEPDVAWDASASELEVSALLMTADGELEKRVRFSPDLAAISMEYGIATPSTLAGSRRLAHVTLNPNYFDQKSLFYAVHNGGDALEVFRLSDDAGCKEIDQGRPVSRLVSASTALGMTGGVLYLGDKDQAVGIEMARSDCAGLGLITSAPVRNSFFVRACVTVEELDETRRYDDDLLKQKIVPPLYKARIFLKKTSNLL